MRKILFLIAFLLLTGLAHAADTTLVGTISAPQTTVPLKNGTISLTMNQASIVTGSAALTTASVQCYTSVDGAIKGLPNVLVAPSASANYASGTVPIASYYVAVSYWNLSGVTTVEGLTGPTFGITLSSAGTINVTAPTLQPSNASGYRVYVGTVPTTLYLNKTVTGFGATSVTSYSTGGGSAPITNSTVCKTTANDSTVPQTTYRISMVAANGATVPGGTFQTYLTTGTVDVSNGFPIAGLQPRFPQPIIANPASQATQSVNSPLTLNGYSLTAGTAVFPYNATPPTPQTGTGYIYESPAGTLNIVSDIINIQPQSFNNVKFCNTYTGANTGAKYAACIAAVVAQGGGVADGRGLLGGVIAQNIFAGITEAGASTVPVTVLTGCGTHTYSVAQVLTSNLTIRDEGHCTKFYQANLTNLAESFKTSANATNVNVYGFTVDGNATNNSGAAQAALFKLSATTTNSSVVGLTLQNFYGLTGSTGVCLYLASANTTVVQDNTIKNCGGVGHVSDGIYVAGIRNRIVHNYIDNVTDTAIPVDVSTDVVVTDNTIVNCIQGITADSAIAASTGNGVVIANNIITGGGAAANGGMIWVFKGAGTANSRVAITGNIIKTTTNSRGILVEDSSYVTVTGNNITDTTVLDGIRVYNSSNVTVTGNTSNLSGLNGFYIHACTNCLVAGNTAVDNAGVGVGLASGIRVLDGTNVDVFNNQSHDTRGGAARQAFGLLVDGTADNVFVTGNDLRFNLTNPGYSNASSGNVRLGYNLTNDTDNTPETVDYLKVTTLSTTSNCTDSAGAAACGSAIAGSVVIDAAATSVVVSTTAVTANSQIFLTNDSSLNTRLGVTCNTQSSLVLGTPRVTARTAATSFTATIDVGPTTNPMCLNFSITN